MQRIIGVIFSGLFVAQMGVATAAEPTSPSTSDGRALVESSLASEIFSLRPGRANLAMRIVTPGGAVLERELTVMSLVVDGKKRTRMRFTAPRDQLGVELLTVQSVDGDGETLQYLYLPNAKKVRRISRGARHARFQGSDFTFADLDGGALGDATFKVGADSVVGGVACRHVDVLPGPNAAEQTYTRVGFDIATKANVPLKVVFYGTAGTPVRELRVKKLKKLDGSYVPTKLVMRDLVAGSSTTLTLGGFESPAGLSPREFTPEALGR